MPYFLISLLFLSSFSVADSLAQRADVQAFAKQYAEQYGKDETAVLAILAQGKRQDSIIQRMTRPAEKALSWGQYRRIFLEKTRLQQGLQFWQEHAVLLDKIANQYAVEPEIIVAILGIETRYGRVTGKDKVLDALMTLAFEYAPRATFFKRQLAQFLLLSEEQKLAITDITGSYAGAMGPAQFIASSYRDFAVDGDQDGRADMIANDADIIASVAHYFAEHHWQAGHLVAIKLVKQDIDNQWLAAMPNVHKASFSVQDYRQAGIKIADEIAGSSRANLIALKTNQGIQHWLCFDNFYVISRYNHSYLYSMAVFQFSQLLRFYRAMP